MMLSGSGDSSAVFSLLAALSDPEAAKARLQEISDATGIYQKIIEDFRVETKVTKDKLEALQVDAEAKLAEANKITNEFNATHEVRSKQLSDLTDVLAKRQATVEAKEATQTELDVSLTLREKAVSSKEFSLAQREDVTRAAEVDVLSLKNNYEAKLSAIQAAVGTNYVMKADAISFGTVMGTNGSI